jgi:hypothetical protein
VSKAVGAGVLVYLVAPGSGTYSETEQKVLQAIIKNALTLTPTDVTWTRATMLLLETAQSSSVAAAFNPIENALALLGVQCDVLFTNTYGSSFLRNTTLAAYPTVIVAVNGGSLGSSDLAAFSRANSRVILIGGTPSSSFYSALGASFCTVDTSKSDSWVKTKNATLKVVDQHHPLSAGLPAEWNASNPDVGSFCVFAADPLTWIAAVNGDGARATFHQI